MEVDLRQRHLAPGHAGGARVPQGCQPAPDRISLRNPVEIRPREGGLFLHPSGGVSTVELLQPAVRIRDLRAEVILDDGVAACRRIRRGLPVGPIRANGRGEDQDDEKVAADTESIAGPTAASDPARDLIVSAGCRSSAGASSTANPSSAAS